MSSSNLERTLVACCLLLSTVARGEDSARTDQLRFLYSGQLSFTPDGYPVVPVGIMDGKREVTLYAQEGLKILPDGEGGPEVRAGSRWTIRVEGGTPARLRYSVVLERLTGERRGNAGEALERWKSRGQKPRLVESGSLFGVKGVVLDRRAAVLLSDGFPTDEAARARAEELAKKWKINPQVQAEIVELPRGTLIATAAGVPVEVRNDGVLWLAPVVEGSKTQVAQVPFGGVGAQAHTGQEDRGYFGKIYVTLDIKGTLAVVNAVPSNQLLAGLVPAEIPARAPPEALKAQAVAARTELLAKIGTRHQTDPYRVCSTQHCQVYAGAGKEHPRATAAVVQTRGEVLFRQEGSDLVEAYYSASCGGFSENNENIWPDGEKDSSLRGHLDGATRDPRFSQGLHSDALLRTFLDGGPHTYCEQASYGKDRYRWTVNRTGAELERILAPLKLGAIKDLVLGERGVSGRIRSLTVKGARGERVIKGDLKIRQTLGGLKSAMFVMDVRRENGAPVEWRFSGAGFGHGVGLCQTGAIGMAEAGLTYQQILQHYYVGSRIAPLY